MEDKMPKTVDIVSVGELLIDFISTDFAERLEEASNFKRLFGGSPANMCMNMARLGNNAVLVSTVGEDELGNYLIAEVESLGVDCSYMGRAHQPTTLILVTRSKEVSKFEAYRGADAQILATQLPDTLLKQTRLFHTTCFGLSLAPAQHTIINAAQRASQLDVQLSIDANYAQKIWPDRKRAQEVVKSYCGYGALVKMSEVDWERLYESPLKEPSEAAAFLLSLGAKEVCLTLGSEGCYVATEQEAHFLEARQVEVKDTTGAGDAFWSGYLTAWLDDCSLLERAMAGRRMAERKLGHFGALPQKVPRADIYEDFK